MVGINSLTIITEISFKVRRDVSCDLSSIHEVYLFYMSRLINKDSALLPETEPLIFSSETIGPLISSGAATL